MSDASAPSEDRGIVKLGIPRIRFPFWRELKGYSVKKFRADLLAGATLTLVSIPQAIGFSLILNLPPLPVILAMMVGGLVGSLFFSSPYHVFGPTSSVSLIVATTIAGLSGVATQLTPLELAGYLALLIGAVQLLAGLLNFGEVTKFISRSVVIAYSAAIGIILAVSQLQHLLGVSGVSSAGFWSVLRQTSIALAEGEMAWADCGVGVVTFLVFFLVQRWKPHWPEALVTLGVLGVWSWLNVVIVERICPGSGLMYHTVRDIGALSAGVLKFSWIGFSAEHLTLLPTLFGSAVAIGIIGMLESASITKGLASKSGRPVDTNQELVGMGAGNIACAIFGAVPGSSSFTRSAVNYQSGAQTQLASMFSSVVVLLVLLFVTPVFNYIPLAALAAHLIRVGFKMVVLPQIRVACRSTRSDAVVFWGTLGTALFLGLDVAIYVGIGLSLALFLQKTSEPMLVEYAFDDSGSLAALAEKAKRPNPQIAIIHVEGELFFGAADVFLTQVRKQAEDENIRVFILRMKNARNLDASTVMALETLHEYLEKSGRHLLISGCTDDVMRVLHNSGIIEVIGEENVFSGDPTNPNVSTRRALLRASTLLEGEADIRIFYDKRKEKTGNSASEEFPLDFQI